MDADAPDSTLFYVRPSVIIFGSLSLHFPQPPSHRGTSKKVDPSL